MSVKKKLFGKLPDGQEVFSYSLKNKNGAKVKICEYGATVISIKVPDRNGSFDDVVCGYSDLNSYINADGYQGAIIGRVGNRIGNASFILDGKKYDLAKNDGNNSLHGGDKGFNAKLWSVENISDEKNSIELSCVSEDMEEGYPGRLDVKVRYTFDDNNALTIDYFAKTDKKTIVNLTNHTYFNLGGYASGRERLLSHTLYLDTDTYLPTDSELIPTGEILSVCGTALDFRKEKTIGEDFNVELPELKLANGFDHCLNFTARSGDAPMLRAVLKDKKSGRVLKMYTDQPALQFYTGNFLKNPDFPFKNGCPQTPQMALCLEAQKMPDSINHGNFTSTVLDEGETYTQTTSYVFSAE